MTNPVAMACAVCRQVLNTHIPYGSTKRHWRHPATAASDHEPVPTPADTLSDVIYHCDFCNDTSVAFAYSTTDDTTIVIASPRFTDQTRREQVGQHTWMERTIDAPAIDITTNRSLGGWLACAPCAELVDIRDCERLITRFRRRHPELNATRKHLRANYMAFFRVIGLRAPFGEQQTSP
ncbi:hypothetical protein [Kutzneria sp. 744]|uniref:hypothetical protein n=1 Tax=Kutzneria sp. (strain 744) TaxID=345341 RepID=UPI0003EEDE97|nr:hypothetical protein [Kutzneria sp. 744]EWM19665.1 hypothetical protein KUTG_09969 [Kutzneria sp. 744]